MDGKVFSIRNAEVPGRECFINRVEVFSQLNLQDTSFPSADASVKIHKPSTTNMFTQICSKVTYSLQEAPFDLVNQQLAELRYRRDRKGGLR